MSWSLIVFFFKLLGFCAKPEKVFSSGIGVVPSRSWIASGKKNKRRCFFEFNSCLAEVQSLCATWAWFVVESDWPLVNCRALVLSPIRFVRGVGMVPTRSWMVAGYNSTCFLLNLIRAW